MASDSPNTEGMYEQDEHLSTSSLEGHFVDQYIDPNAQTQIIDNNKSFDDEVCSMVC